MKRRKLNINVAGRANKVKTNNFLVCLFEAISNSIHSIEDRNSTDKIINITILRNPRQQDLIDDTELEVPITGFEIEDNGSGFTEPNMESFCEADSVHKAGVGGKGVGRFSWLKFFEKASIESVFLDGEVAKKRTFTFSSGGIEDENLVEVTSTLSKSMILLSPIKIEFESKTKKSLEDVSISIIEHFISYLVTNTLPNIILQDGSRKISIKKQYEASIGKKASKATITINGVDFQLTGISSYQAHSVHQILLCGHKRVAEKINLNKRDAFFSRRFIDINLQHYVYHIFVESSYLDGIINDDREGLRFPEIGVEGSLYTSIMKEEIIDEVVKFAHKEMIDEIEKMREENRKTITNFVAESAPQYRYILNHNKEAVASIHETDPVKIDSALRKLQFEEEQKTKVEIRSLLKRTDEKGDSIKEEFDARSSEVFAKLNEAGKSSLANYIVQRKLILEFLQKKLEISKDGSRAQEDAIHQLIFPMRSTSDEVNYENQNLWIIDERLSYHYFLASDKPLNQIPPAESKSRKEPDIAVFNRPIALNDRPEDEQFESIVIIEFKRPGESSVDGQKNPVDQILEYIEQIQEGRAQTRKGRPFDTRNGAYFFGYAICELDPLLKKVLVRKNMRETQDGRGMFGYFQEHRAYIEVISYDKMLSDAKKRNRILFDKLQIPIS